MEKKKIWNRGPGARSYVLANPPSVCSSRHESESNPRVSMCWTQKSHQRVSCLENLGSLEPAAHSPPCNTETSHSTIRFSERDSACDRCRIGRNFSMHSAKRGRSSTARASLSALFLSLPPSIRPPPPSALSRSIHSNLAIWRLTQETRHHLHRDRKPLRGGTGGRHPLCGVWREAGIPPFSTSLRVLLKHTAQLGLHPSHHLSYTHAYRTNSSELVRTKATPKQGENGRG